MSLYSGVTGKIKIKVGAGTETEVVHMSNWDVDFSKEIKEVVSFGNDYAENVPGVKKVSATSKGAADFDTANGQKALFDAFDSGAKVTGSFYLDATTFLTGDFYIESLKISHDAAGNAEVDISLKGNDATTLTIPA